LTFEKKGGQRGKDVVVSVSTHPQSGDKEKKIHKRNHVDEKVLVRKFEGQGISYTEGKTLEDDTRQSVMGGIAVSGTWKGGE